VGTRRHRDAVLRDCVIATSWPGLVLSPALTAATLRSAVGEDEEACDFGLGDDGIFAGCDRVEAGPAAAQAERGAADGRGDDDVGSSRRRSEEAVATSTRSRRSRSACGPATRRPPRSAMPATSRAPSIRSDSGRSRTSSSRRRRPLPRRRCTPSSQLHTPKRTSTTSSRPCVTRSHARVERRSLAPPSGGCAIVCATVRNACNRVFRQNFHYERRRRSTSADPPKPRDLQEILERSGAGVEPTQPGAARPHRF
jgi:hypothetical protein